MKPTFELRTDELPIEMEQIHSSYGLTAVADRTNIVITGDDMPEFFLTWDQQLSLNIMLHMMDGPIYHQCDDCGNIMITPDMDDRQGEPILKSDDGIKISGNLNFAYVLNEQTEQQFSVNWNDILELRDFLTNIDNIYRA